MLAFRSIRPSSLGWLTLYAALHAASPLRIPTHGHSGLASDIFDVRAHGKDERVHVEAFHRGQEYLYRLVKALAGGGP